MGLSIFDDYLPLQSKGMCAARLRNQSLYPQQRSFDWSARRAQLLCVDPRLLPATVDARHRLQLPAMWAATSSTPSRQEVSDLDMY